MVDGFCWVGSLKGGGGGRYLLSLSKGYGYFDSFGLSPRTFRDFQHHMLLSVRVVFGTFTGFTGCCWYFQFYDILG
jgi:hypothetical protein